MGIIVGIATALTASLQNVFFRRLSDIPALQVNWVRFVAGAIIAGCFATIFSVWQIPPARFWFLVGISVPLELALGFCYVRAFQLSPQSVVGPLFSLSAVFLIPMSYFLNGELPSFMGFLGIISVLVGAVGLGWDLNNPRIRTALGNIFRERGSMYMLGAAFLAGITVAVAKFVFQYASPLLFAFWVLTGLAIVHTPLVFRYSLTALWAQKRDILFAAGFFSLTQVLHYTGINLTLAAYFISYKRLSIVFDVFLGRYFGRETHFRERLIGAGLMVAGVVLITFAR